MKVYLKIHKQPLGQVVAACDEEILGKCFISGKLKIDVTERFYKGKLKDIEEVLIILGNSKNFNIVGQNIIQAAIQKCIISDDAVLTVQEIPIAMKITI